MISDPRHHDFRSRNTAILFDYVADTAKWRAKLKVYEHRYKDAGGTEIAEQYGN